MKLPVFADRPMVSVVIPAHNQGAYLPAALRSVFDQSHVPVEIIVVDDGSEDNTNAVLAEAGDSIVAARQSNQGLSAARNRGIELARGAYVQFLDADDLLEPTKIARQVQRLDADPALDIAVCDCVRFRDTERGRDEVMVQSARVASDLLARLVDLYGVFPFPIHCALFRRDVFRRVGSFERDLKGNEDRDLWIRVVLAGLRIDHQPFPGALYRQHGESMTSDDAFMTASRRVFQERMLARLPGRVLGSLAVQRSLARNDLSLLQGLIEQDAATWELRPVARRLRRYSVDALPVHGSRARSTLYRMLGPTGYAKISLWKRWLHRRLYR